MRENLASILKQSVPTRNPWRHDRFPNNTVEKEYHTSTCTSSRDNYKVSVWLAICIRNYLDTASYGSSRQYMLYLVNRECCVFEHGT